MASKYLISISSHGSSKKDIIYDTETKLKVAVIDLLKDIFKPKKGEKHYFASHQTQNILLAFETEGYSRKHKNLKVLEMIARYCAYLGSSDVRIHSYRPLQFN